MIKRFSFMLGVALPSFVFAQTAVPSRPNHTLTQYRITTAANNNADVPSTMLRMAPMSAARSYATLWPPGGIRKDTRVPSLYADGSAGTLEQIGRMADGSVQQTDIGATVAPLDSNGLMSADVGGSVTNGRFAYYVYPVSGVTIIAGGAGYKTGDTVTDSGGYQVQISAVDSHGGATRVIPVSSYTLTGSTALLRASVTSGTGYNLAYKFTYADPAPINSNTLASFIGRSEKLNDYGVNLDGKDAASSLKSLMLGLQNNHIYHAVSSSSSIDVTKTGYNAMKNIMVSDPFGTHSYYGDGVITESLDEGLTLRRYVEANTNWVTNYFSDFIFGYTGATPPTNQSNRWIQTTSGKDHFGNIVKSRGKLTNIRSDFNSYGVDDSGSYAVNIASTNYRYGTDWQWAYLGLVREDGAPDPFIRHNTQEWLSELDYTAWGPDGGSSGNVRNGIMITGNQAGGGYAHPWQSAHAYQAGDLAEVEINGRLCSVVAVTAGTSGSATPGWSALSVDDPKFIQDNPSALPTLADGSVTWRYNGILRFSVDNGLVVSYQPDRLHAQDADAPANQYGVRTPILYHQIIKTDALFDGPLLNFANAQFLRNQTDTVMRMPSDSYLDMSAVYNNATHNNRRLLGYDSNAGALSYKVNGVAVLNVKDNGTIVSSAPAQMVVMTRAQIRAYPSPSKGMEIYDSDDDAPAIYTGAGWKLMTLSALPAN